VPKPHLSSGTVCCIPRVSRRRHACVPCFFRASLCMLAAFAQIVQHICGVRAGKSVTSPLYHVAESQLREIMSYMDTASFAQLRCAGKWVRRSLTWQDFLASCFVRGSLGSPCNVCNSCDVWSSPQSVSFSLLLRTPVSAWQTVAWPDGHLFPLFSSPARQLYQLLRDWIQRHKCLGLLTMLPLEEQQDVVVNLLNHLVPKGKAAEDIQYLLAFVSAHFSHKSQTAIQSMSVWNHCNSKPIMAAFVRFVRPRSSTACNVTV